MTLIKKYIDWINVNKVSFFIFVMIGSITASSFFVLFTILWKILKIDYPASVSIAYIAAITFYFFANRSITFKSTAKNIKPQLIKFILLVLFNYLITITITFTTVELFLLSPYIGIVLAIGTTTILSYFISKFWVFQL